MGLSLTTIGVFIGFALIYTLLIPRKLRQWTLFLASIVLIYTLQPDIFVRWLDFIFPTLTVLVVTLTWHFTRKEQQPFTRDDGIALALVFTIVISLSLLRYASVDWRWVLPSRPPPLQIILVMMTVILFIAFVIRGQKLRLGGLLGVFILVFIVLKTDALATGISQWMRSQTGQDITQASAFDLNWLGFSYVAFRLIHTIRDRQSRLLPELSLKEYMTYVLFFPSFIAGPIDRAERFIQDFRNLTEKIQFSEHYAIGMTRIAIGIGKKFVIADTLAQGMALNPTNALQVESTIGAWVLLYGYALRLYFDFSGYTDIVIGIGILFGITLPENFKNPYMQTSITKFWQSWHITLSNWVRFYVFSPLSRYLLKRKPPPSAILIVLLTQLATMIVIGLWHGITLNFLIWGIWHGLGLFIHKQWTDRTRKAYRHLKQFPRRRQVADGFAWLITFQFVVLSWVWFVLPDFNMAMEYFAVLVGIR